MASPLPTVLGIETAVTDYIYDENKADSTLRDLFLRSLKPESPPRKGENILVNAEELDAKFLDFAQVHHLTATGETTLQQAESIRDQIFGKPRAIEAGGALANSFYLMANAKANGSHLVKDAVFLTAIGNDKAGMAFDQSLEGHVLHAPAAGRTMVAHIIPVDGDRIIIASPSFADSCDKTLPLALEQLKATDLNQAKMILLGGYMKYSGMYNDFLDVVLEKVQAIYKSPEKRPVIVLTAGAQPVAESEELKTALDRARAVAPVIISANTGEFRRLMQMDKEWRAPHESKWAELEGEALEKAKQADPSYMKDKAAANDAAFAYAYKHYCENKLPPVTFVVTNGKHGVRVVSAQGVSETYIPPKPPHGVVNTVGGGDAFAGGYLLGQAAGLPEAQKAQLGFIAAGEVIGQDAARLNTIENTTTQTSGLPAYLDATHVIQKELLRNLVSATSKQERM